MPRKPYIHSDERLRKRQRRGVARLPTEDSGSSNSSNNLAEAFSREVRPLADATNRPPRLGNRVTPSSNKMLDRDDVGASPQPLDHQSNASLSHNSGSSSRSSMSSYSRNQAKLPPGVIDIYSRRNRSLVTDEDHNSISSLTNSYVHSYGQEFYQLLRSRETGGTVAASQSSADDSPTSLTSPVSSTMTPNRRVVYVPHRPILGRDDSVSTNSSRTSTLPLSDCIPNQPHLTPKMRAILIDWLIELSEEYKLSESTIFCAAALVNASLECGSAPEDLDEEALTQSPSSISSSAQRKLVVGREMLQCLGCACMWMASKMEEIEPPSVDDFVYISDNSYTKEQITNMEMTVCSSLKFRLCYTTPYMFMDEHLRASGKVTNLVRHLCLYLLEISLLPLELTSVKPSLVCGAAVYLCRVTLGMTDVNQAAFGSPSGIWTKTLEHYTGYSTFDLEDVVKVLHNYHMSSEESSLTSVFTKYKTAKYSYVALKTVPMEFGF